MAEQQDNAQRTEEPTPKRLAEARKKGDAPKSQELIATVMLFAGAVGLWLIAPVFAKDISVLCRGFIDHPHDFMMDGDALQNLFVSISLRLGAVSALIALLVFGAALLANVAQAMPVFTTERMKPSFSKISPLAGAKRLFGPSGLFNFAKGVGKLLIVGALFVFALWPDRALITRSIYADSAGLLSMAQFLALKLIALAVAAMAIIAGLDYAFQRHSWRKRLRMTREEVRREMKETEGDPHIKARQRALREGRARQRIIENVKTATVVIMNPTHFAVALQYEQVSEHAPICVGKGVDELALRIRQTAREAGVPVVENPPLARALYAAVDMDEEIPVDHYEAVANIIGFIMGKARRH